MLEILLHDLTPGKQSLWLVGLSFLACLLRKAQVFAEIARIGTRAPRIPFRISYAIDFIAKSIKANKAYKDVEYWSYAIKIANEPYKWTTRKPPR